MNGLKRFLLAALLVLLLAAPTQAWVIVQDIGPNNELIDNNTDGMIDFAGRGGADNTDIRFDLDGTYPIISSPTDSAIGIAEILYVTGALLPVSADGSALGSATLEWSDVFLADSAVITLGADQDTTLTHVPDVGVLLNSSRQLQFGDAGTYLHQSIDGTMGLVGDTIATITAPDIRFQFDAAAYLTIAVANAGAVVISTTSDGTDQITIGDDADIIIIAASTWDVDASGNITTTGDIGSATVEIDDIFMQDASVINFGADQEVTLTHVHNTGVILNSAMQLQFGDAGTYIAQSVNGTLSLVADTIADVTAPDIRLMFDSAAYLNIATADTGATVISQVSDGTDQITIGDGNDRIDIASDTWDVANGAFTGVTTFAATGAISTTSTLTGNRIVTNTGTERVLTTAELGGGIVLVTAAVEVQLPDLCDSATGAWVTIVQADANEVIQIAVTDTNDQLFLDGANLGANYEIDSAGAAQEDDFITLYCRETNEWHQLDKTGTWVDGGTAD